MKVCKHATKQGRFGRSVAGRREDREEMEDRSGLIEAGWEAGAATRAGAGVGMAIYLAEGVINVLTYGAEKLKYSSVSDGVVAQLVEHHNGIVGVRGSNPLGSTIETVWLDYFGCASG